MARDMSDCSFCNHVIGKRAPIAETDLTMAVYDAYPLAEGHTLVLPKRHVGLLRCMTPDEQADLWAMTIRILTARGIDPEAADHNIWVNDSPFAGQTAPHVHLHIIPRRPGDVADPSGGVRWVIPDKADYWSHR
jgi:diadenosine tetraphosphate (Ap4A) HIT family hydrolase